MKIKLTVFVVLLTACIAYAQVPAATGAAAPSNKATKGKSKKTGSPLAPKTAKPKAEKPASTTEKPAEPGADASAAVATPGRKRDPFISPVEARLEGGPGANCSGGKRCLAVNEVVLRGIVKSPNGMIAVVENAAQKTYFLHENDPIYNGFVEKITPDSVIFKEHYLDNLGHDSQREVVKTVNAPVV